MCIQCGGEVVKIHAHQIKRCDVVFLQRGEVFGLVLVGQDAAVNFGVQRLDAAAQNLREAGDVAHRRDGQPLFLQEFHGSAGRYQFHPPVVQEAGEFRQAVLVGHAQERAPDGQTIHSLSPFSACFAAFLPNSGGSAAVSPLCQRRGRLAT